MTQGFTVSTALHRPAANPTTIKAMVVDDSAVVRQVLVGVLNDAPGIEVIATAADPLLAIEKMRQHWPDVIVLDVEMPRMDGITFLRKIMSERPTPVVICSTLTEKGARGRQHCAGHHHDRHGRRWRRRPAGNAPGRRRHRRPC
ncbi:response regulator, partial [Xanthomonas perforans]